MTFNQNAFKKAEKLAKLVIKKQRDYGSGNILNTPVDPQLAVLVRLNDKLQRAGHLLQTKREPQNESLLDTAMDIMGYGMILWMLLDDTFELELDDEQP